MPHFRDAPGTTSPQDGLIGDGALIDLFYAQQMMSVSNESQRAQKCTDGKAPPYSADAHEGLDPVPHELVQIIPAPHAGSPSRQCQLASLNSVQLQSIVVRGALSAHVHTCSTSTNGEGYWH